MRYKPTSLGLASFYKTSPLQSVTLLFPTEPLCRSLEEPFWLFGPTTRALITYLIYYAPGSRNSQSVPLPAQHFNNDNIILLIIQQQFWWCIAQVVFSLHGISADLSSGSQYERLNQLMKQGNAGHSVCRGLG